MDFTPADALRCRKQFPALGRRVNGHSAVYFDGPAGTQVPRVVIDAIADYLSRCNANHQGLFATSRESDALLDEVHAAVADLVGSRDPAEIAFGANMTSLTFALSRALSKTWKAGDEIVVTRLEHDANFSPWVLAARDVGAVVRYVDINSHDCTLNMSDFHDKITSRTRLVAVGCASNATGTVNDVQTICHWARHVGALTFLDAVHFAPHDLIDVGHWNCDFLVCSAYKFFGPHVGILWGRHELLLRYEPYKLRPAPDTLPGRWMSGTQNHEGLAGVKAAIDYLADLGRGSAMATSSRRESLISAYTGIRRYESALAQRLIAGLQQIDGIHILGITDADRASERLPTISLTHNRWRPHQIADRLGREGIFVWHGNYYALPLTEALGLEPDGMVRVGLVHYNTSEEVERFLAVLSRLVARSPC